MFYRSHALLDHEHEFALRCLLGENLRDRLLMGFDLPFVYPMDL